MCALGNVGSGSACPSWIHLCALWGGAGIAQQPLGVRSRHFSSSAFGRECCRLNRTTGCPPLCFAFLKSTTFLFCFVFLRRQRKDNVKLYWPVFHFKKMGFRETGQIGFVAAISIAEVRQQLCQLKIVEVRSGWKECIDVIDSEKYLRRSMSSILEAPYTLKDGT